ncbi:helix-turn-helix domain-containing protein [Colwellia sp. MB3u-55]|jgi:transcriptional regulator with XRE-family HTH domain|nr:helix-turn-helix domain-containing protein [Colwellia sp. MB3u-55]MBA6398658.1 helix-turn-helix domain-containing protein [Colwellia sp. BRX10-4]
MELPVKSLRLEKCWSQEQLAQLSDLNVRTIQRVEKGESIGIETLKSLAAVFEISTDELICAIDNEKNLQTKGDANMIKDHSQHNKAKEKVKSIKYFYTFSALLIAIFLLFMLPNYNDGENLGPLIVVFLSFCALIAGLAFQVFQPFGEEWEKEKISQILNKKSKGSSSSSEH